MLAMALYPEVQQRAQAEIDGVVGNDRMPTLQDRADLPYVNAVITESLRWHVAVPLGTVYKLSYNGADNLVRHCPSVD